ACTGLAILALSPRLFLQPILFSFFFLAVTLWLLQRPRSADTTQQTQLFQADRLWLLPLLFALWSNLDAWFVLGLLLLALFCLGEVLQPAVPLGTRDRKAAPPPDRRALLGLVLLASVVACLLNPNHFRVFTLPIELSLSQSALAVQQDREFNYLF